MKIHEYQARVLLAEYGVPSVPGETAGSPEQAAVVAKRLGGKTVVKAQVLAGGRGKAGGVKIAKTARDAKRIASDVLATKIKGLPVTKLLVTTAVDIRNEYYLGITVDRAAKRIALIASAAGGIDIEELAVERPQQISTMYVDRDAGIPERDFADRMQDVFETPAILRQARDTAACLLRLFGDKDCSLVEINPLAQLRDGRLIALDAKINFDDNAIFRHPELEVLQNQEEYTEEEATALQAGLSFVQLDGDIGCIVNGAGLAMATMDMIKLVGAAPANFLDVGGSSNPQKMVDALRIIAGNPRVRAVLVNIFGGITRCDDIAQGIIMARQQIHIAPRLVIRLIGTNEKEGRQLLQQAGMVAAEDLTAAVKAVVATTDGGT